MVERRNSFMGLEEGKFWTLKEELLDIPNLSDIKKPYPKECQPPPFKCPDLKTTKKPAPPPKGTEPKTTENPNFPPSQSPCSKTNTGSTSRSGLTEEETARRANLSNAEKQQEARDARAAWKKNKHDTWWHSQPSSKPTKSSVNSGTSDPKPKKTPKQSSPGAEQFYKSAADPEKPDKESEQSAKQRKNEKRKQRAAEKQAKRQEAEERRREKQAKRQEEEEERRREKREAKKEAERLERFGITQKERLSFETWSKACADFFADSSLTFPKPPTYRCKKVNCIRGEHIEACHHDVERTMLGSGCYTKDWLKKERLKWHPDKFHAMGKTQTMASEMFVLIQRLIDGDRSKEE